MYPGFHQDPKRTNLARLVGLVTAWVVLTAFAIVLLIQTTYESSQAEWVMSFILALLVLLPIYSKARGRSRS